jgi:hypothetical protein
MPWWGWLIAFYVGIAAIYLIRMWPRECCPRCYYPLHRCECYRGDYGHDPHVARTVRRAENDFERSVMGRNPS